MVMFIGEYRHSLDSKNRLIIPAKFRDGLGDSFIVTKGLDGCLTIYAPDKWDAMIQKLLQIPSTKKEARQYLRSLTSKATECSLDSQGRIQLPAYLLNAASIQKACVVVGVVDRIEIWPEEHYEDYDLQASESFDSVAESLTEFLH